MKVRTERAFTIVPIGHFKRKGTRISIDLNPFIRDNTANDEGVYVYTLHHLHLFAGRNNPIERATTVGLLRSLLKITVTG